MNPQYIQQQKQFYGGQLPNAPGFGEPNANVPVNPSKGPHDLPMFPMQKSVPGPSTNAPPNAMTNAPPRPGYYENNGQEQMDATRQPPPPAKQMNHNSLADQMSNISLTNPHRPPSAQSFHGTDTSGSAAPPSSGVNGISNQNHYSPIGQESILKPLGLPLSGSANTPLMSGNQYQGQTPHYGSSPGHPPGPTTGHPPGHPLGQHLGHPGVNQPGHLTGHVAGHPPGPPAGHPSGHPAGHPPGPPAGHPSGHPAGPTGPPSGPLSGPPTSHPPVSGQPVGPPTSSPTGPPPSLNAARKPPMPGQMPSSQNQTLSNPSLPNQTRRSSGMPSMPLGPQGMPGQNLSQPPVSNQQNLGRPMMSGQQNIHSSPLMGQHNLSGPPLPGQNMSGPPLPRQHMSGPPLPGQNMSGPPSPGQQHMTGPPLPGQNMSGPPLPGQNMSGPPLPGQNMSGTPLPGQNMSGPPYPGQNMSGPYPGQNMPGHHPGQTMSGPPLPGQNMTGPPPVNQPNAPGYPSMTGQMPPTNQQYPPQMPRQYTTGPPTPEQNAALGTQWQQPGSMPNYQPGGYQQGGQDPSSMYGGQYQGAVAGTGYPPNSQGQVRRLDPEQMPSPIQVIQDDQRMRCGEFITNQKGLVPPLVTTNFTVRDQGNASPRFIRSTMYSVSVNSDMLKQTSLPFGIVLSPMARTAPGEYEPPIVDMGEIGPVRCIRCKAYMCPFMQFIDSGRKFQCMFCKATTEVPQEYFQHLDHTGQRMDRYERPELMLGTFEFLATKDYCRNNTFPKPPAIIFVIDVSYNNVKSGLVHLICAQMKSMIRNLPIDAGQSKTNMRVGFITYNNTVHFYNIKSSLAQPQMMVVGDVQDVFMPLLDGFLCDPEESEIVIDSLMTQIPNMFADTRETETILAPAIQAGLEALKASECAGKLLVFHSSLPTAEAPGKLKNRDDRKLLGTDKEKTVLTPQTNVYNNLGQDCVGAGCSVDLFIFNNSYIDIATIGQVARLTGGEVYKYTYFQADTDGERLITDIVNNISRPIAFDAVMRVRTSTGVRPTDFYGHFFMSNTTDMELASIDCDKAVAIEIKHDDKLTEDEGVYIQAALLYTSCGGIRRLRVINLSLKTTSQMGDVYRTCDLDAIINFFSKQSVFKLLESSPKAIKENLSSRCAIMLASYRKNCATPTGAGQLILPECMKLLPLYINCLEKSDALNGGGDITIDQKTYVIMAVATMPVHESVIHFYPRLISLHDVDPQGTDIPPMTRCTLEKFVNDGAYLLENGIHMFLWLGLNVNPQWVQAVFGVASVIQIDTDKQSLPVLDNPLNRRVTNIIASIQNQRRTTMKMSIVRQREKLEMVVRHFLVEDRSSDTSPSYVDYLCHMHKQIRSILS